MSLITFDFETFFDTKYTLKTLSYTDYIFDEKFKAHGAAVKLDAQPAYWLEPDQIPAFIDQHREDTWVFHNAQFDASILALVYNFTPRRIMDTLALAALLVGWHTRLDLGTLAIYFDCPLRKGKALASTKGIRVLQDHPAIYEELKDYACLDVEITYWLLQKLLHDAHDLIGIDQQTLKKELAAINLTNQLILPRGEPLHIDLSVVQKALKEEQQQESAQIRAIAAQYQYSDHEFVKMLRSRTAFPAFMERLGVPLPTKISARTGKDTYALGKNDTALLALREQLDGTPEGEILALRENVSSTIKRTRSERILRMALRGEPTLPNEPLSGHLPVPVHINYAGASKTLRWSGGNKVNLQNLPRGSALRQAIIPPPGHKIVVCDYSSVEARVLGWLADDDDLLAVFRRDEDVYVNFGLKVWGELAMLEGSDAPEESEEYKPFKKRRFVSKTCFGADTPVLTRGGWKRIVEVTLADELWDGEEWVKHEGVLYQGVRQTLEGIGVNATSDHEILTEHGWVSWRGVLTKTSLLESAKRLASLPSSTGSKCLDHQQGSPQGGIHTCDVRVVRKVLLIGGILGSENLGVVMSALKKLRQTLATGNIKTPWKMTSAGKDYLIAFQQLLLGVITQKTAFTAATGREGYMFATSGEMIVQRFCNMYKRVQDGITRSWRWIERITAEAMSRAILGLSLLRRTIVTGAKYGKCRSGLSFSKRKMPVYDIQSSGSRKRFTIGTSEGPLIAHNCTLGLGYSASWTVLERVLRTGSMGAKVILDREICAHIGMDRQEIIQRLESMKEWVLRDEENGRARWAALMAPLQRDPSLLWHYGACMRLVEIYRTERWAVTNLWKQLEPKNLMASDRVGHIEAWVKNRNDLSLRLPGGSVLVFPQMRLERRGATFIRAGVPESTYGAKITENVTQGTARNLLRDAWIEADRAGLNVVLTVHDEIVCVEKEQDAEAARDTLQAIMSHAPAWAEGLPVDAEAKIVDSYSQK